MVKAGEERAGPVCGVTNCTSPILRVIHKIIGRELIKL